MPTYACYRAQLGPTFSRGGTFGRRPSSWPALAWRSGSIVDVFTHDGDLLLGHVLLPAAALLRDCVLGVRLADVVPAPDRPPEGPPQAQRVPHPAPRRGQPQPRGTPTHRDIRPQPGDEVRQQQQQQQHYICTIRQQPTLLYSQSGISLITTRTLYCTERAFTSVPPGRELIQSFVVSH